MGTTDRGVRTCTFNSGGSVGFKSRNLTLEGKLMDHNTVCYIATIHLGGKLSCLRGKLPLQPLPPLSSPLR